MMWVRSRRAPELFVLLLGGSLLLCSVYLYLFPAQLGSLPAQREDKIEEIEEIGDSTDVDHNQDNDNYNHQPDAPTPSPSLNRTKPTHKALRPAHHNFTAEFSSPHPETLNRTREALLAAHRNYTAKVRSFALPPTTTSTRRKIWRALMMASLLLDLGWDQHSWPVRCCAVPTRVCDSRLRPAPVAGYANS
jgi:hypothetical protein